MPPRSIWSGAISFGLVNVPVKLYTAVRSKDVRFHQLHEKDGSRIKQKRFCELEDKEVPYEEIVKGYELGGGQYVMIDPDELDALDPEATHTIDIEDFVELEDIDPLFYDNSYYMVPDERGGKAYRLLLEAMRDANRVGIATVVMRTKQYLVAVRPVGDALVMSTMNFADEVVPQEDLEGLPTGRAQVSERELKMAQQLIESLATDFDPDKYRDTYRERVLDLIEQKAAGKEIVAPAAPERKAPVVDLMAALEASLTAAKEGRRPKAADVDGDADSDEDADEGKDDSKSRAKKSSAKKTAKKAGSGRKAS
ncbi:MAG: Ku protein [Actinobacteria bacterium]|nr:Ku protein [Actinomycetota bacterium]